jgi:predicted DNA binding protein
MKFLRLTFRQPPEIRHPMQDFLRSSSAVDREELLAWTMFGSEYDRLLFYVAGEMEPYREAIADVDRITSFDLTRAGEEGFYAYVVAEPLDAELPFREAFVGLDLVLVPPIVFDGEGDVRLTLVGDPAALQAVVDGMPEGVVVDVERIGEYDHRRGALAGALTERQREAVETAVEIGYYAVPRRASLAAVAAELDVAESTASTLLRRAEASVMARTASMESRVGSQ